MKTVRVAELKARLRAYLRLVRHGQEVTVLDRQTPIARIVPYNGGSLRVRPPVTSVPLRKVPLPPPLPLGKLDVVDLLLEERQGER
jgi:prevent-host-death family protein